MKRRRGRKLLVATAGLATVMYVACKEHATGNLPAPPPTEHPPGNLPSPPPVTATGTTTATVPPPDPTEFPPGNLPAPPPMQTPAPEK